MDAWSSLSLFESTDIAKRFFEKRHNRQLNTGKASEIASSLAQGREYFLASKGAGELVRPLLQYYGVLSLSRAVILFLNPPLRECGLANSHGLSAKNWGQTLSGGVSNIGELKIEICRGTFYQLIEAVQNKEISEFFTAPHPNKMQLSRPRPINGIMGSEIKVKSLMSRIHYTLEIFESSFNNHADCFRAYIFNLSQETHTDIDIMPGYLGLVEDTLLREKLKLDDHLSIRKSDNHNFIAPVEHWRFRLDHKSFPDMVDSLPSIENDSDNNMYIISKFDGGYYLSNIAKLFMLSYFLGMLVRYHPTKWLAVQSRHSGDFIFPLIRESMNVIDREFPQIALEHMS